MKGYPFGCQAKKKHAEDIVISVKLFDAYGSATWYLSEYDPEDKIAYGYVTGLCEDEWGDVSLEEMEELKTKIQINGIRTNLLIPRIEVDRYFKPCKF
jgi:hypothetical protein